MGTEIEQEASRPQDNQEKVVISTVPASTATTPSEIPRQNPLDLPRSIQAKAKIRAEWREFRKRYLTLRRVLFWFFWIGIHVALFTYGWIRQKNDPRLATTNTIGYSVSLSRGAGLCIAFDCVLIIIPMLRTIITTIYHRFDFLALDENVWFHRQVAYALLFFTIIHVTGFYVNFYRIDELGLRNDDAYSLLYKSWAGITGWIMCLCMFLMYTTATQSIRIMSFETFRYTHALYWVFFVALLLHAAGCFVRSQPISSYNPAFANIEDESRRQCLGYNSWRYVIISVGIYFLSICYGAFRALRKTTVTHIFAHPERVIEIRFKKPSLKYMSGHWLWLQVPSVSHLQWHPFTITSSPTQDYVSLHIRCVGDWTDALAQRVGMTQEVEDSCKTNNTKMLLPAGEDLKIRVDGPFGAPAELVYREQAAICVGAGIGITPWASVLKDIYYRLQNPTVRYTNLKRLDIIWVCQNISQLQWFANLLEKMQKSINRLNARFLHIQIYLTRSADMNQVPGQLRAVTYYGRPRWEEIIGVAREQLEREEYAWGVERVGVYLCGGHALGKELAKVCRTYTDGKYKFRFKKEHF